METSKIGIFESISLLSNIMPLYGSSHEGFLVLSLLSKSIRSCLLERYPEYRIFMLKYAKKKECVKDKHLEMKLPLDLFKFSALNVDSQKVAEFLVSLIHTIFKFKLFKQIGLY